MLEQYCILSNTLGNANPIKIKFATAYNRYGEDKPWLQERVRQFFAEEELIIGKEFWNFVSKSENGYKIIIEEYKDNCHLIKTALEQIKQNYLGE